MPVSRVLLVLASCCQGKLLLVLFVALLRWEPSAADRVDAGSRQIKLVCVCGAGLGSMSIEACLGRRGDEEGSCGVRAGSWPIPQMRWFGAAIGRDSSTAFTSSTHIAEGRLLPSWMPATTSSVPSFSCWRQLFINLQAMVPIWRPSCSCVVSSRCVVPSGSVPGDGVVDCAWKLCRLGGDGAGPDRVFLFNSGVLCAKCRDLDVIFSFADVLAVICTSTSCA